MEEGHLGHAPGLLLLTFCFIAYYPMCNTKTCRSVAAYILLHCVLPYNNNDLQAFQLIVLARYLPGMPGSLCATLCATQGPAIPCTIDSHMYDFTAVILIKKGNVVVMVLHGVMRK